MSKAQFLAEKQREGETYAGLILGQNGEPDYHLFLIPGEAESVTWKQAKEFAQKVGGDLPTRRELSILFVNAKIEFTIGYWYWSSEESANKDSAWHQSFLNGMQICDRKIYLLRARAVRRLPI